MSSLRKDKIGRTKTREEKKTNKKVKNVNLGGKEVKESIWGKKSKSKIENT